MDCPGGLAALAPVPLEREGAEHDRLGRALGARAGRLARGVEEVGEHPDAALLDLGRARVLRVVDEVAVQVRGDDPLRLGLHPGRHERRQVARRVALEGEVLADQPHRVDGGHARVRELPGRHLLGGEAVAEQGGVVRPVVCVVMRVSWMGSRGRSAPGARREHQGGADQEAQRAEERACDRRRALTSSSVLGRT